MNSNSQTELDKVLAVPDNLLESYYAGLGADTFAGFVRTIELPLPVVRSMLVELLEIRRALHRHGELPKYENPEQEYAYLLGFYEGNGHLRRELKRRGIDI